MSDILGPENPSTTVKEPSGTYPAETKTYSSAVVQLETPPTRPEEPRFYIPGLDGLRIVAFAMVFVYHAVSFPYESTPAPIPWAAALSYAGKMGVPIFFVLSAFLITRLLLIEREKTGGIDLRAYFVRRTLRIWPLYFLAVAIGVTIGLRSGQMSVRSIIGLATFTANWQAALGHGTPGFTSALWSVSVEEQFYVIWPFVLAALSRRGIARASLAMVAIAILSRIGMGLYSHDGHLLWFSSVTYLDALGLGSLLALFADRIPTLRPSTWSLAFVGLLLGFVVQGHYFPIADSSTPFGLAQATGFTFVPLLAAALVALAVKSEGSFLTQPWMVWLGRLTFGMYVFHPAVLRLAEYPAIPRILTFPAVVLAAYASYHLYEKHFIRLKRRFERVTTRPAN